MLYSFLGLFSFLDVRTAEEKETLSWAQSYSRGKVVGAQGGAGMLQIRLKTASLLSSGKDLVCLKEDVNRFGVFLVTQM